MKLEESESKANRNLGFMGAVQYMCKLHSSFYISAHVSWHKDGTAGMGCIQSVHVGSCWKEADLEHFDAQRQLERTI
jgi:hypothetical protein